MILGEDENCYYVASEENQIRNISKNATIWTPDPGSYFIASLKKGLIESGTTRKVSTHSDAFPEKTFSSSARVPEIDSTGMGFEELNREIHAAFERGAMGIRISNLSGQRYLGIGLSNKRDGNDIPFKLELSGVLGNCLANLNSGGIFEIFGNVADDLADTMHSGKITVHGSARDVVAQALQGGDVFVRGSVGNRAAIQMREYQHLKPYLVVGETADDYLGEYMAGGIVAILNLSDEKRPVGYFRRNRNGRRHDLRPRKDRRIAARTCSEKSGCIELPKSGVSRRRDFKGDPCEDSVATVSERAEASGIST